MAQWLFYPRSRSLNHEQSNLVNSWYRRFLRGSAEWNAMARHGMTLRHCTSSGLLYHRWCADYRSSPRLELLVKGVFSAIPCRWKSTPDHGVDCDNRHSAVPDGLIQTQIRSSFPF
jgi:hypothetical protein